MHPGGDLRQRSPNKQRTQPNELDFLVRFDPDSSTQAHSKISQRFRPQETVDVHAVARSDTMLVAGASDGSVAAWDAASFQVRWRGSVGASVQAIALALKSAVIVPIGVGAAAAPAEAEPWQAVKDAKGRTYYYNRKTKETTWTDPRRKSAAAPAAEAPRKTAELPAFEV